MHVQEKVSFGPCIGAWVHRSLRQRHTTEMMLIISIALFANISIFS